MNGNLTEHGYECTCGMSLEDAANVYEPLRFVLEGCVQIGINVFGFVANSIAMVVLFSKIQKRSLFDKTLFILAILDATFNVCDILKCIRSQHYDGKSCSEMAFYQKIHLFMVPQFLRPLRMYVIMVSVHTTVVIALERYLAVSKPIISFLERDTASWKKLFQKISPVLLISLVLTIPNFLEFYTETKCWQCSSDTRLAEVEDKFCTEINSTLNISSFLNKHPGVKLDDPYYRHMPVLQWSNILDDEVYFVWYRNIIINLITYLVPIIMLFSLNLLIYKHLKRRRKTIKTLGK